MNDPLRLTRRRWLTAMACAAFATRVPNILAAAMTEKRAPLKWVPGLQLYTLGLKDTDDLGAAFKQVAAVGYRDVEFPGNYGKTGAELRKLLDDAHLTASAAHITLRANTGRWKIDDLPTFAADLKTLGIDYACVPVPYFPDRIQHVLDKPPAGFNEEAAGKLFATLDADDWKRTADLLNEKATALRTFGVRCAYHNHGMDFHPLPGDTNGYRILVERTDPHLIEFELDIGWAVSQKQDVAALFTLLGKRLRLLHLKDVKRSGNHVHDLASCDVGTGIVDWTAVVELMRHAPIAHAYVEQETPFPTTPMDAIRHDYTYLTQLFAGEKS